MYVPFDIRVFQTNVYNMSLALQRDFVEGLYWPQMYQIKHNKYKIVLSVFQKILTTQIEKINRVKVVQKVPVNELNVASS